MEPVNEKKPIDETGGSFDVPNIIPEAKHTTGIKKVDVLVISLSLMNTPYR